MLHDQCNCSASYTLAKACSAVIRLSVAKMRGDFFAIVGGIQWLPAAWANAAAAKTVLDFKGAEQDSISLTKRNFVFVHHPCSTLLHRLAGS
ncbi:hypothetical protein [Pseudomonas sp. SJZ079]|uniref:hypothetical protein n=1 Tax=Pseudomonas sp. SJZ079 TaxID=2572887 RepID=UPI0011BDD067|nr:hypothetical protein [Pseudomonas sp. SJZ079]